MCQSVRSDQTRTTCFRRWFCFFIYVIAGSSVTPTDRKTPAWVWAGRSSGGETEPDPVLQDLSSQDPLGSSAGNQLGPSWVFSPPALNPFRRRNLPSLKSAERSDWSPPALTTNSQFLCIFTQDSCPYIFYDHFIISLFMSCCLVELFPLRIYLEIFHKFGQQRRNRFAANCWDEI